MPRYAKVDAKGRIIDYKEFADGPNVDQETLAEGKPRWLPVEVVTPEYDPSTHRLNGHTTEIQPGRVLEHLTPQPIDFTMVRSDLNTRLAELRWSYEVGGIDFKGERFPTDRGTRDRIDSLVRAFEDGDIAGEIDFKIDGKTWKTLDEKTLREVKAAIATHVQWCFSHERALAKKIAESDKLNEINLHEEWE